MKKLMIMSVMASLLVGGIAFVANAEEAKAPAKQATVEEKANEACTKKGLAGDLLAKCVQSEKQKLEAEAAKNVPATAKTGN